MRKFQLIKYLAGTLMILPIAFSAVNADESAEQVQTEEKSVTVIITNPEIAAVEEEEPDCE